MAWSENSGTKVTANIYPIGKFPTHHAIFGRGGYKTVANESERLAIPIDRLTVGSIVRQHDTGEEWVVKALPQGTIDSDVHTGKDCTWEVVKKGGIDENQLSSLAKLDQDGKVLESQSRAIIYRGNYVDETTFNSEANIPHNKSLNAIYIDNRNGKMYTWTGDKFVRDALYWNIV